MIRTAKLYQRLEQNSSPFKEMVDKLYCYANETLPKINRVFSNFTGHGISHSINIMHYMYDLITDIEAISDLEITCLIYAALLHDVGMVVTDEEEANIKDGKLIYHDWKYSKICENFQNEKDALQEYIRLSHGERAFKHVMEMEMTRFVVPGYTNCNFREEVARICQAHTMDHVWLLAHLEKEQVKGNYSLNAQYLAMLLRLADYLDIDEQRTPIELYKLIAPKGIGDLEWKQHYVVENAKKIVKDDDGTQKVVLYGRCDDSKVYKKILQYLSSVSEEISWCTTYTKKRFTKTYKILLSAQIDNKIRTQGFELSDLKIQMDYHAIKTLLMGEHVYFDKRAGLRELIQNSIDACLVLAEELKGDPYSFYTPQIQIILDYSKGRLLVKDNGTGMKYDVLTKYFLNIGKSYYKSKDFLYRGLDYRPIGFFGIGFWACFMLSNDVIIETKHFSENEGFTVELEADSEYVCTWNQSKLIRDSGTVVILDLEQALQGFERQADKVKEYIIETFLDQGVRIQFCTNAIDGKVEKDDLKLNAFHELNSDGVVLDSSLNEVSASLQIDFSNIKVSSSLSELCLGRYAEKVMPSTGGKSMSGNSMRGRSTYSTREGKIRLCVNLGELGKQEFIEYDPTKKVLYAKDLQGSELDKYIKDGNLMVIRIVGVNSERKEEYETWREQNYDNPTPPELLKTVYFPIEFENALLHAGATMFGGDTSIGWSRFYLNEAEETSFCKEDIEKIIAECNIYNEMIDIGVMHVAKVGKNRFIEHESRFRGERDRNMKRTVYCHGIKISHYIDVSINIFGVYCGNCAINILRDGVSMNIARNELLDEEYKELKIAMVRAAYSYMIANMEDIELKETLQDICDSRYPFDTNNLYLPK